ncbi:hypothetical protein HYFRA_00010881 [Hymenoscyphus fraxineus]|uniref:mRNA-capping enzyme subunit beta n=1 Tax=Hymenoscyphus fraxineus TaxID=746836 RepID=A0A9N9KTF6_9HELO|nr:hypothetical protein HYFRA_00010881 [Hymenoscyphus fraxineus]
MDLRSIINTEAGEGERESQRERERERASAIPKQATPVTPNQPSSQQFRDFAHPHPHPHPHPAHPSPGSKHPHPHPSHEYLDRTQPGRPYTSSPSYPNNYSGRPPPPPPIQAPPHNDLRSPARFSAQSPYQQTPSSNTSQYPFPPAQTPQSPAQHHQYPASFQHRDSFSQSNPPPPHLQQHNSLGQQHGQVSPAPQTPPIGMPGAPHPYLQHQRSHSSVSASTPTPTSAHSQQPPYYPPQYSQDSPGGSGHFSHPQISQHQRHQSQQSQPGTPLGPPLTQRQSSGIFPQPSSPYQQRTHSQGSFSHFSHTSPAPPAPATLPRHPSTPSGGGFDSQRTSISEQRRSQSERERSLSVSPKTRLPSQTPSQAEIPFPQPMPLPIPQAQPPPIHQTSPSNGPTKRKMEDREPREEPRIQSQLDSKPLVNGDHRVPMPESNSPKLPPKKRIRYVEPPIWAQSVRNKAVFVAAKNKNLAKLNGGKQAEVPIPVKVETNGGRQPSPVVARTVFPSSKPDPTSILGPWETSLINERPVSGMTKAVSDYLYAEVVSRDDFGELSSRGVEIEIEAKLGQLIDKGTNQRYILPVISECVIPANPQITFKSSMTLPQHSHLNGFLNAQVQATAKGSRVPVTYRHRRETDKFYELPPQFQQRLPAALRERIRPNQSVSVRVTHDQKTDQVIAKIIKVRISNLDIYIPQHPLDCRISINFEWQYDGEIEEILSMGYREKERRSDRQKDRLGYIQGPYQIDLTQVTHDVLLNGVSRTEKEHELEIEVNTGAIREQGMRARDGAAHMYPTLVDGLLNNVIILSKEVPRAAGD